MCQSLPLHTGTKRSEKPPLPPGSKPHATPEVTSTPRPLPPVSEPVTASAQVQRRGVWGRRGGVRGRGRRRDLRTQGAWGAGVGESCHPECPSAPLALPSSLSLCPAAANPSIPLSQRLDITPCRSPGQTCNLSGAQEAQTQALPGLALVAGEKSRSRK